MRHSLIVCSALALFSTVAHADRRAFVHTYEYMTAPEGNTELEFWNTQSRSELGEDGASGFDLQIEIEHGLTRNWDIALYQVLEQTNAPDGAESESLHFAATKLETRYRFAERGEYPVDTLAYFEVAKEFGETKWEIEPKLVLSRDFGKATIALNLIPELEIEEEKEAGAMGEEGESELEVKFEPGWALGVTYELSPKIKLGAETFGKVKGPGGDNQVKAWTGPSVSWAPSKDIWVAANAAYGLSSASDELIARFIVGIGL